MPDPLAWIVAEAEERARLDLTRRLDPRDVPAPGRAREGDRVFINFASNDYLGLANDRRVVEAARRAATDEGWGSGASPLVSGWRRSHQALADDLAEFEQAEAALLFPSGFAANLGAVAALAGRGDAVYLDRLAHACLVAGAKVAGASVRVFPHNDLDRLGSILRRDAGRYRRSLIATEGVFSMDGDLAPLAGLVELADRFGAMLLVDEAHGTGVFGPDGRGAASECGVAERVHVRVGTFSKALGSIGGFVVGSRLLIDHVLHRAPSFVYSTATPPAAAAAAREALAIARAEPWRRERVRAFGGLVSRRLAAFGFEVPAVVGPIVPWIVGDSMRALSISRSLRDRGLLVPAIRPPTVPRGTSRLRISLSAAHDEEGVRTLLDAAAGLVATG